MGKLYWKIKLKLLKHYEGAVLQKYKQSYIGDKSDNEPITFFIIIIFGLLGALYSLINTNFDITATKDFIINFIAVISSGLVVSYVSHIFFISIKYIDETKLCISFNNRTATEFLLRKKNCIPFSVLVVTLSLVSLILFNVYAYDFDFSTNVFSLNNIMSAGSIALICISFLLIKFSCNMHDTIFKELHIIMYG